jgi:hypothetical protein
MANRPDHLPLEQPAPRAQIDKIVKLWCTVNPRSPTADIIRAVQNQLPPLHTREARLQQANYIQRSVLEWKK